MRQVRREYRISRQLLAEHLAISADQVNRIERGLVSLRLGPAWDFCELTKTDPYWLAFGDPRPRIALGIFGSIPDEDRSLLFLSRMRELRDGKHLTTSPRQQSAHDPNRSKIKLLAAM